MTRFVALALLALLAGSVRAQAWPQKPVKLILPLGPGAGADIGARLFADGFAKRWGQPVVVENRPGGDALARGVGQSARAGGDDANQAIEIELGKSRLGDRRQIEPGHAGAVGDRQQLDAAGLRLRAHDGVRRRIELDTAHDEVVQRADRVLVPDALHLQAVLLDEAGGGDVGDLRDARPVELPGIRLREIDELL